MAGKMGDCKIERVYVVAACARGEHLYNWVNMLI